MSISSTHSRTRRILVIANETLGGGALHQTVVESRHDDEDFAVILGRRGHRLVECAAAERLVRDHENAPGV